MGYTCLEYSSLFCGVFIFLFKSTYYNKSKPLLMNETSILNIKTKYSQCHHSFYQMTCEQIYLSRFYRPNAGKLM